MWSSRQPAGSPKTAAEHAEDLRNYGDVAVRVNARVVAAWRDLGEPQDTPEWDARRARALDGLVRYVVHDRAAELIRNGEELAPGGKTLAAAVLREQAIRLDDLNIGADVDDMLLPRVWDIPIWRV